MTKIKAKMRQKIIETCQKILDFCPDIFKDSKTEFYKLFLPLEFDKNYEFFVKY